MPILAIDTSSQWCSVAIFIDSNTYFYRHQLLANTASQYLLQLIQEVLDEAKLELSDVALIAVSQGPGAFTGIRLGVGVAQGMAFATNKPLIPIPSLDGMVTYEHFIRPKQLLFNDFYAAIDARMGQIYLAHYKQNHDGIPHRSANIELIFLESLNTKPMIYLIGHQLENVSTSLIPNCFYLESSPHALGIAICASQLQNIHSYRPENCQPLYIRDKVAQTMEERKKIL